MADELDIARRMTRRRFAQASFIAILAQLVMLLATPAMGTIAAKGVVDAIQAAQPINLLLTGILSIYLGVSVTEKVMTGRDP